MQSGTNVSKAGESDRPTSSEKALQELMLVFHPGKDMTIKDFNEELKTISTRGFRFELYFGEKKNKATLASPLGRFNGRKRIEAGLAALKYINNVFVSST